MRSRRVTKGRPACAAANATRPKQRLSNARQAAALECFATSSTDFGENSDVQQMSAQQEPQDEHDDPGRWSSSSLRRLSRVVVCKGTRGQNESTLAYVEAWSEHEMQMRALAHELDRERLALQIGQHGGQCEAEGAGA
ncbi:uncharacterized protein [Dermacentor albipictus]|uniref:uncharacterized protein isoform X3 n=1 Tax=Dermacentor albipictus TaxID=60249 RepID=UPI0038FC1E5A